MSITGNVERGSIVWMQFRPNAGNEQAGYRPGLILSDGLIDPSYSNFAVVVPVTNQAKGYAFEVEVPAGIKVDSSLAAGYEQLSGVVLTDQLKSLDLAARNAVVVGKVDTESFFFKTVLTYARSILA
ncbi:transcriptional modulator of MazE/toxin, MazF [Paenibacillaceae bacterium GAS479]|nr:transcriptional modulator of MazE/toxin, MazF [Paenibacillaceae bacterium GAS479]